MQVTTARMQVAAANASARLSHHAGWTSTAADVKGVPQEAGHLRKQANIPEPRDACKVTASPVLLPGSSDPVNQLIASGSSIAP